MPDEQMTYRQVMDEAAVKARAVRGLKQTASKITTALQSGDKNLATIDPNIVGSWSDYTHSLPKRLLFFVDHGINTGGNFPRWEPVALAVLELASTDMCIEVLSGLGDDHPFYLAPGVLSGPAEILRAMVSERPVLATLYSQVTDHMRGIVVGDHD